MASTAQEHLDLVNSVITKRLQGDGYQEYSEAEQRFSGASLKDLYGIRQSLREEVGDEGGGMGLIEPFGS